MALSFEKVKDIFMSYGLKPHTIKHGECTEFSFEDRTVHHKKKNVATRVTPLVNGGVGGYIYVDHLREYDNHPSKTKMGHIPIGNMTEGELRETIEKVIKDYR